MRTLLLTASVPNVGDVFCGPARRVGNGIPENAVFILEQGGHNPQEYLDGGLSQTYRSNLINVRVRSAPRAYGVGKARADGVWRAFQKATASGYVRITMSNSAPLYMGQDEAECDEWVLYGVVEFGG